MARKGTYRVELQPGYRVNMQMTKEYANDHYPEAVEVKVPTHEVVTKDTPAKAPAKAKAKAPAKATGKTSKANGADTKE